jgi:hypothetical protein
LTTSVIRAASSRSDEVEAQLVALELDVGAAGHVGDQHAHVVADQRGSVCWYRLASTLMADACRPALCAKPTPDVGLGGSGADVRDRRDGVR